MDARQTDRLLRLPDVSAKIGLGRSAIYDKLDTRSPRHDPTFPRPSHVGKRAIAFSEIELDRWIARLKSARDEPKAA